MWQPTDNTAWQPSLLRNTGEWSSHGSQIFYSNNSYGKAGKIQYHLISYNAFVTLSAVYLIYIV